MHSRYAKRPTASPTCCYSRGEEHIWIYLAVGRTASDNLSLSPALDAKARQWLEASRPGSFLDSAGGKWLGARVARADSMSLPLAATCGRRQRQFTWAESARLRKRWISGDSETGDRSSV